MRSREKGAMAYLYVNSKGKAWTEHSYSAGNDFDQSPIKYYLRRVLGWKEKDNKARFLFGKALEEAIQYHHEHNGEGSVAEFQRLWSAHEKDGNVTYTDTEKNWANCNTMGTDMIRLYMAMQPKLPIPLGSSVFQRKYGKEVFPGDPNYGGILDIGKLDIITYVEPNHPMLPKVEWKPEYGAHRPLIVDIKTAANDFPEQPGMAGFDTQLRRYSWLSGIRDVSLLWFKKSGTKFQKGYSVTFLEKIDRYEPGSEAVIAKVDGEYAWVVYNDFMLEEINRVQGEKNGKTDQTGEAKQRGFEYLQKIGIRVSLSSLTRQRLQFNSGFVTQQSADEAGQIAGRQIRSIVDAWKNKSYPNTFGIRYPKDDRNDPYFRAFILKDENYRKQNFTKSDEQSFDELFEEDNG